jgi:hypothetical protein
VSKVRQFCDRCGQNRFVPLAVVRRAKSAANRMIDKDGARWWNPQQDIQSGTDDQGGNVVALDDMCDETNGLVAEGSVGHQKRQVNARVHQLLRDSRRQLSFDLLVLAEAAHERNMHRRKAADNAAVGQ